MKAWLLKFHRWIALTFALPLLVIIGTGVILSVEPWVASRAIAPGSLTLDRVQALLAQHDPGGQARALAYRAYDQALTIGQGRGGRVIDAVTGEVRPGPSALTSLFVTSRRLHETLLLDAGWLVIASTIAMLAIALLGALLGLPRIRNNAAGWHKAMAWGLLPLIVLSPLTGLFIAMGVTFTSPPAASNAAARAPVPLPEALRLIAERRDLSTLDWVRPQGGRVLARLIEEGEYRVYTVAADGLTPLPRNWSRLLHEGNFAGGWSALMNIVTSLAMAGLLVTGAWIWVTRRMKRRRKAMAGSV